MACALDRGYCTGAAGAAAHQRGIHLDRTVRGRNGAAAGVEQRVVLENLDGDLDRIQRTAPKLAGRRVEGALEGVPVRTLVDALARDRARAAVYHNRRRQPRGLYPAASSEDRAGARRAIVVGSRTRASSDGEYQAGSSPPNHRSSDGDGGDTSRRARLRPCSTCE